MLYRCRWFLLLLLCEEGGPQSRVEKKKTKHKGKCSECFINICSDPKKTHTSFKLGVYSGKE